MPGTPRYGAKSTCWTLTGWRQPSANSIHFSAGGARTDLAGWTVADYLANVAGVANMVESLRPSKSLQLGVFASTILVCRIGYRPANEFDYCSSTAYGQSKVPGEGIRREHAGRGLPGLIVRATSVFGPWLRAPYRDFLVAVQHGMLALQTGVRMRRDYGLVLSNLRQLLMLADQGGGALLRKMVYLTDYKPLDKSFQLEDILSRRFFKSSLLRAACRASPYTMEEGVRITCEWLRSSTVRG